MEIRAVRPEEWPELRELRLRALAGAPDAFSSTLDAADEISEEVWRRRTESSDQQVNLVAVDGGRFVGMCAVLLPEGTDTAQLVAMWVEPDHRSRGVGRARVEEAAAWCLARAVPRLGLWVNEENPAALGLYREQGFAPTGERDALRPGSPAMRIAMERPLPVGDGAS